MIRILPYYERGNESEILRYYLNLVAEVVPFQPNDILFGNETELYKNIGQKPRRRTEEYMQLLDHYGFLPEAAEDKKKHDSALAEQLINEYSTDLHKILYGTEDIVGGSINKYALRELLTIKFPQGKVRAELENLVPRDVESKKKEARMLYKYVFCYDDFSRTKILLKEKNAYTTLDIYQLVAMLDINVCPYCNRQFTSTVVNGKKRVRPQLDHFRNKSRYPFLALSINNLVPSCAVCNLSKHNDNPDILYPYEEGLDDNYAFMAECDKDNIISLLTGAADATEKFNLELIEKKVNAKDYSDRVEASKDTFSIRELYQFHKGYVANLFSQQYILTKEIINDKKGQFPLVFKKIDIKHALRLMDYSPNKWGERPLSKLTHDIAEQIDSLYQKSEYIQLLSPNTDEEQKSRS